MVFPGKHWAGPEVPRTAQSKLKQLEESGELDAGRLKAPPTEEDRKKMAEDAVRSHEHEIVPAEPETPPAGPPKAAPEPPAPAPPPEPAKPDEAPKK